MAEPKTQPTDQSVQTFLGGIEDEKKRQDAFALVELMREVTGEEAKMWGSSIVGFGSYHYKYASGHEGDTVRVGFSPRKQNFALYISGGFDNYEPLLGKLGKHTTGKSCLYIKKLADVEAAILKELVQQSVDHTNKTYPA